MFEYLLAVELFEGLLVLSATLIGTGFFGAAGVSISGPRFGAVAASNAGLRLAVSASISGPRLAVAGLRLAVAASNAGLRLVVSASISGTRFGAVAASNLGPRLVVVSVSNSCVFV